VRPIIIVLHICVCVLLILIVLLQKGKGAGMGAAFGGSSQTVFGSAGASGFLQKGTTIVAIVFMLTSLSLSFFFKQGPTSSIMKDVTQTEAPVQAPAADTGGTPVQPAETPVGQP
jgi:preprotein translocase subunit SecG